jgi:hypothetical protein
VSIAVIILLVILAAITGLCIAITTKRTQRSATEDEPYYASLYDVILTKGVSITGVDAIRNQAYGTRAEPHIIDEANGSNQDSGNAEVAAHDNGQHNTDLDEDGYVDVNAQ